MSDAQHKDEVCVALGPITGQAPIPIGWLAREAASLRFQYDRDWLDSDAFRVLDPMIGSYPGTQFPGRGRDNFGLFEDISPDRWGSLLMQRREDLRAAAGGHKPRALTAWDFLLGVQDETRMGAVRLRDIESGCYFNDSPEPVPPVTELRALEAASRHLESALDAGDLEAIDQWLRVLVAPGSSLGGARPKCNFRMPDGSLWIAKFPASGDRHDVGLWEQVLVRLAGAAGINTAESTVYQFGQRHHTYCVRRFDRNGSQRIAFASAMNFTAKTEGNEAGYLDLVQALDDFGTYDVKQDLQQLFRRVLFNVLVSNRDDHLRNHGFFVGPDGIGLAPAFDVNPTPGRATHAIAIDEVSAAPDTGLAMATARLYGLDKRAAGRILDEVAAAIGAWRDTAADLGATRAEILFMEDAFRDGV